jgi:hypothetical protein
MRRPSPAVRIFFATVAHARFCDDAGAAARRCEHEERREDDIEGVMLAAAPRDGKTAPFLGRNLRPWRTSRGSGPALREVGLDEHPFSARLALSPTLSRGREREPEIASATR